MARDIEEMWLGTQNKQSVVPWELSKQKEEAEGSEGQQANYSNLVFDKIEPKWPKIQ